MVKRYSGNVILTFVCLIITIFCLFSLCGCKDKNGYMKAKPSINDARTTCIQEIEKNGEYWFSIQLLETNKKDVEPNTFYFVVNLYAFKGGITPKQYLYIVSYAKNDKKYYEPQITIELLY